MTELLKEKSKKDMDFEDILTKCETDIEDYNLSISQNENKIISLAKDLDEKQAISMRN